MNKRDFAIGVLVGGLIGTGVGFVLNEPETPAQISSNQECSQNLEEDGVYIKVNEMRLAAGRKQLARLASLTTYAQLRADEIAASKNVEHKSEYGSYFDWEKTHPEEVKTNLQRFGENLAGPVTSACQAVEGWKESPTHFDSLTDSSYSYMGVGVKDGYVVVMVAGETR